jgi:hypothetical protein
VSPDEAWPWVALAILGAYHGINPSMGWLFAVALGLQERRRAAVLQALPPIALGHELSVALVVALVSGAQALVPLPPLRLAGAAALLLFGAFKLLKPRAHFRWVGMRVGPGELVLWSFLMSTAHGAGLMLAPALLGIAAARTAYAQEHHIVEAGFATSSLGAATSAIAVHSGAMLLVAGAIAIVVYRTFGLRLLRSAWVNLDRSWAVALIAIGALMIALLAG